MEVKPMFATKLKRYGERFLKKGIEKGIEQDRMHIARNMKKKVWILN